MVTIDSICYLIVFVVEDVVKIVVFVFVAAESDEVYKVEVGS